MRNNIDMPIKYLFIDGGYFRETLKTISTDFFNGDNILNMLDFRKISINYRKVFYYDCLAPKKSNQRDEEYKLQKKAAERFF